VSLWAGVGLVALLAAAGLLFLFAPPADPYATGPDVFAAPSPAHPLGTDNIGRDTFSRVVIAGGIGVAVSAASTVSAALAGSVLGLLAGYFGGWLDAVLMRGVDGLLAIPGILIALVIRVMFGAGPWQLILAMGIIFTPMLARVMRGPALVLRDADFTAAARVAGISHARIILTHILPNAASPLLVQAAAIASSAVGLEAALSYLGQGIQPPTPSAGRMVEEYQSYLQTQPQLVVYPALAILALAFGWNLIADGLQRRLSLSEAGAR
jgi:peptide/nickel transport system permease protein